MGWLSPPDRREITLLLFCTILYILASNLETSLQLLGVDSVATSGALFSKVGLGITRFIDRDGRKPDGWRDSLEDQIYGDWGWDAGHVAGNGDERTQRVGSNRHGAVWTSKVDADPELFGELSVNEALEWWLGDVPQTKIQYHVPGYTVLDNVYISNGSVYLVTDDTKDFPAVSAIVSSSGPGFDKWTLLSKNQAATQFGDFGGVIRGVSWLAADPSPHNSTLLALWRTYSSLDPTIDTTGRTRLVPPHRLILPHHPFFTDPDPNPDPKEYTIPRRRVDTGFHPYLLKAAFPQLTVMYHQDFADYAKIQVPFVFERIVVADRAAAAKVLGDDEPRFVTAFEPPLKKDNREVWSWWEPIRSNMVEFLDLEMNEKEKVVTYVVKQDEDWKATGLKEEDHTKLISALKKMERNIGCEVNIVYEDTRQTSWIERMEAIVRSTVVLGVHGDHLLDSAFMKRSSHSTLIELFPEGKFARDRVIIADSLGQQYIAYSGTTKHTSEDTFQVSLPRDDEEITIDMDAVVQNIQQIISRM